MSFDIYGVLYWLWLSWMHCIGIVESRLKVCFYSLFNVVDRGSGKLLSTKVQTIKRSHALKVHFITVIVGKWKDSNCGHLFSYDCVQLISLLEKKLGMNSTELVYHNFNSSVIKTRAFFGQQISSFGIIFFKSIRHLQEKRRCNYVKYFWLNCNCWIIREEMKENQV